VDIGVWFILLGLTCRDREGSGCRVQGVGLRDSVKGLRVELSGFRA
jgi:hypothetical protein